MDLRRVNHPVVLEAAVSVAVDFTEVVLADSEAMELAALASGWLRQWLWWFLQQ